MGEHRLGQRLGPTDTSSVDVMLLSKFTHLSAILIHILSLLALSTFRYVERCYLNHAPPLCFHQLRTVRKLTTDTGAVFLMLWQHGAGVGMLAKAAKRFAQGGNRTRDLPHSTSALDHSDTLPHSNLPRTFSAAVGPKSKI